MSNSLHHNSVAEETQMYKIPFFMEAELEQAAAAMMAQAQAAAAAAAASPQQPQPGAQPVSLA